MPKHLQLLEPTSDSFLALGHQKHHAQEDFGLSSSRYPIFVVADGVTLIQFLIEGKPYPNPSPAGDVARIFCEAALKTLEAGYDLLDDRLIRKAFEAGNQAVGQYNQQHGRTKRTSDYWFNDLYAATAALVAIKDGQVYWGSICDSFVWHFDEHGSLRFRSPLCHSLAETDPPKYTGDPDDKKARQEYVWGVRRNGLNAKGQRLGYGVITGEPAALAYLSKGHFALDAGDLVAVSTDGFQEYMALPEFIALFRDWSGDLETRVKKFTARKSQDEPEKFGHERTLIIAAA